MAHSLTLNADGKAEMAYVGEKPWHGLGSQLSKSSTIETWIKEAGMDWAIKRAYVRYPTDRDGKDVRAMEDNVVLFRSDNGNPLSIVSSRYNVVQPREVLEFFRDLCEFNGFELETAGTLFGGKRFWALANIGADSYVRDQSDKFKGRLLLATACDGTMKTVAKFLGERVVCNNTLQIGLREGGGTTVKVSHRSVFHPEKVKTDLGVARESFGQFIEDMNELSRIPTTSEMVETMTLELLMKKTAEQVRAMPRTERIELLDSVPSRTISSLYFGAGRGSQLKSAAGTAYGWLNAVTEYIDHRSMARSDENRFNASMFGAGDAIKRRAFEIAMNLKTKK